MASQSIDNLLPHGEKARIVDTLDKLDRENHLGVIKARLAKDRPYWNEAGEFRSQWLIEALAQAIAVVYRATAPKGSENERGYLLAVDDAEFTGHETLKFDDELILYAQLVHDLDPMGVWTARAETVAGAVVASGRFKCVVDREGAVLAGQS